MGNVQFVQISAPPEPNLYKNLPSNIDLLGNKTRRQRSYEVFSDKRRRKISTEKVTAVEGGGQKI